jgi:hypothetical protein
VIGNLGFGAMGFWILDFGLDWCTGLAILNFESGILDQAAG